jgi:segregation and condensation protein A
MDAEQVELPYHVRLERFEGPLDLLLHLIRKHEIDIYDIPIALITQQYLEYLSVMKSLNLGLAGEFLVMAATLVQIKSRLLLPADERGDDDEAGPDPREELVRQLLEYKRFKEAAGRLEDRERLWRDVFSRDRAPAEKTPASELNLDDVTLFDLVDALNGILANLPQQRIVEIFPENLTVKDRMNVILELLEGRESVTFETVFADMHTRPGVIVTFLALLEVVRLKLVRVFQGEAFGPIVLMRAFSPVADDEPLEL